MLPRLLRSFLFLILFFANYLPVELCAGNFFTDNDGADDELYAIYFADADDDFDNSGAHIEKVLHHTYDHLAGFFYSPFGVRSLLPVKTHLYYVGMEEHVPLFIRKRVLQI